MIKLSFIVLFLGPLLTYSQINTLPHEKRYRKARDHSSILESIRRQNSTISRLLSRKKAKTVKFQDQTQRYDLPTGTAIRAQLGTAITSSNSVSPIIAEITEDPLLPSGTRFICKGEEKGRRVHVHCHLAIIEQVEYPIAAQLLNSDHSAGLKGKIYTGDDTKVAGLLSQGLLELVTKSWPKATQSGRDEISRIIEKNSSEAQKTIISIEKGHPVIVYFNKRFSL